MVKIIETHIIQDYYDMTILDHQSRVVEFSSWEEYVDMIKNYTANGKLSTKKLYDIVGCLNGISMTRNCIIKHFKSDDMHLDCHFITPYGHREDLLAYLIKDSNEDFKKGDN